MPEINSSQQRAIATPGSVLVTAGAGTGKTRTLVERCLARVLDSDRPCSLDRFLVVTFTEAAATEMRRRIREGLAHEAAARPDDGRLAEQAALVDTAAIGTLHGFCARLIREHFHELALDPDVTVLDEGRAAILQNEVLTALLESHYGGSAPLDTGFRELVRTLGRGSDLPVAGMITLLHDQARARPHPDAWLDGQIAAWTQAGPELGFNRILAEIEQWREEWHFELEHIRWQHPLIAELARLFSAPPAWSGPAELAGFLREAAAFGDRGRWPRGETSYRKSVDLLIAEAREFLESFGEDPAGDVLRTDWAKVRGAMTVLIELAREFMGEFTRARREAATVDFSDLEQLALQLLVDDQGQPTPVARTLRERFDHVLVDEYQDINAVQDRLLAAVSGDGTGSQQFLVGDLKQSIYGFRLADPRLFRSHLDNARAGRGGTAIPLQANYRSHPAILEFVNEVFAAIMRPELGGVPFEEASRLLPGNPDRAWPDAGPPVEVLLCPKDKDEVPSPEAGEAEAGSAGTAELTTTEIEAATVATRLKELREHGTPVPDETGGTRPVRWSDMVVLLRSPSGRAEAYAKAFDRAGVPLIAARTGLFRATECLDLLNLLRLLDNPLQDLPLLAVLRSPLVGMDVNELAMVRLHQRSGDCWAALSRFAGIGPDGPSREGGDADAPSSAAPSALQHLRSSARAKAVRFLQRHVRWRELARQASLSECLETVLAETHHEDWCLVQPRGAQRRANIRRLLELARDFDRFQRQSVHRFLRFVEAQQEAEFDPEPAATEGIDAVRLMSIHKSKGLEFPVVVVANLAGRFNETGLRQPLLLDETLGLCPSVDLDNPPRRHPTLPLLLARRRQAADLRGEEIRLLYVAMTRAGQKLILVGSPAKLEPPASAGQATPGPGIARESHPTLSLRQLREARRPLDWLMPLLRNWSGDPAWPQQTQGVCERFVWRLSAAAPPAVAGEASDFPNDPGILPPSAADLEAACSRARFEYPHPAATREPAKSSVTALRQRALEDEPEDEAEILFPPARTGAFPALRLEPDGKSLSATERGTAHHRFLQFANLNRLRTGPEVTEQAAELVAAGRLSAEEAASLDPTALAAFGRSPLADRLRRPDTTLRRELEFTLRLSPEDAATLALPVGDGLAADEGIVVQGVVDLAAFTDEGLWLLDFKTDAVTEATLAEKAVAYTPQLALYALALGRIFERPVTGAWLHFLAVNRSVPVPLPATFSAK